MKLHETDSAFLTNQNRHTFKQLIKNAFIIPVIFGTDAAKGGPTSQIYLGESR